jgi:endonuclease G, mitochondrial
MHSRKIFSLLLGMVWSITPLFSQSDSTFNYLPVSFCDQRIEHTHFTLCFSEEHEQAAWVAYRLTPAMINGPASRSDKFKSDTQVKTGSASPADYKSSGFDRGHLAPAADMKINQLAMDESFYMSNMSPQVPAFNRGIWSQLEDQVRKWTLERDTLYVVTAGVLTNPLGKIGSNGVSIPNAYYKILLDLSPEVQLIAFLLPNQRGNQSLEGYIVSVDYLESLTGIDFFPALPDHLEEQLEMQIRPEFWSFH